jgi:NADH-quinone oxidoreductase subunit H
VAGYQTEYSGLKFGMFYVGEFLHAFTISALTATLFLGGWRGPGSETYPILGTLYFFIKTFIIYFVVAWIRISLPRLRIDQMLNFNWKFLTPLAFALVLVTALANALLASAPTWLYVSGMFLVNVLTGWAALELARSVTHKEREQLEGAKQPAEVSH